MPVNQDDVLRIAARQKDIHGSDIVNVYHLRQTSATPVTNSIALAEIKTFFEGAYSQLNGLLNTSLAPLDIKVDKIQLIGGALQIIENIGTTSWGGAYNPSGSGDSLPAGCAALVILRTAVGKVFGRKFINGVNEGNSDDGFLNAAIVSGLSAFAGALITPWAGTMGFELGLLSTRTTVFQKFLGLLVADNIAYQRRRRPGKGS
jgi:hypothetical protein